MRRALVALALFFCAATVQAEPRAMPSWIRLYIPIRPQLVPGAGGGTFTGGALTSPTSISDANFSIFDDGDATKIAKVEVSGVTTGNTVVPFTFSGTAAAPVVQFANGTKTAPSIRFANAAGDGFFGRASGAVNITAGGNMMVEVHVSNGLILNSAGQMGFSNGEPLGSHDTAFARYSAGVFRQSNGGTGIAGLFGGGAAVASAAALPLPTGSVFHVTGTTSVTSITSTNFASGACVVMIFDGILTMTDGGNLKLAGNFVTAADSTMQLCFDGTNWFEIGRTTN